MKNKIVVDPHLHIDNDKIYDKPVIIRMNEFTENQGQKLALEISKAHNTGQEVIPIIVDSYGGSVYELIGMINIIKNSEIPIATIVEAKAMSAGAILFGMGQMRFMAEYATIMLHEVSCWAAGKIEEVKTSVKESDRLNNLLFKLLAENVGKEENYFINMLHNKKHAEWFLTAKEAKRTKICTKIGIPTLKTTLSIKHTLEI